MFFLVARLGEELDDVDDIVETEQVVAGCVGTPVESAARDLAARRTDLAVDTQVVGLEKANLVLALVIAQAVQVLLLSVAVSLFFMVFGSVAIDDDVIVSWIGEEPDYPLVDGFVSVQLAKVSIFLGSFSGLYFTVYAVTDAIYRQQFFTEILRELERAVGVRAVYRTVKDLPDRTRRHRRRYASTACTRRLTSRSTGRSSLAKMLLMCLATAFSVTKSAARDRGVGPALGHQRQHLLLAGGEAVQRLVALPGHHRGHDLRVEDGATRQHPAHAVDELPHVGDPVLEQVADGPCAAGQQLAGVELLDVLRQHQHREAGPAHAHGDRGAQPLVGERRRHPHVEDGAVQVRVGQRARRARRRCRPTRRRRSRSPRAAGSGRRGGGRCPRRGRGRSGRTAPPG